ncbi:hypothetical protein BH20ACT23_BH20ACT23_13500 [soil metagenome]
MSQQPVHHNGAWWSRDPSGLIHYYDDQAGAWKPWDPATSQTSPPGEWTGAPPASYSNSTPQYAGGYPQPVYVVQGKTNGLAIASLVLGILWLWWLGSVLALIFGYVGKNQIDRSGGQESGRGMAIAGIVLGWIGVGTLTVIILLFAVGASQSGS